MNAPNYFLKKIRKTQALKLSNRLHNISSKIICRDLFSTCFLAPKRFFFKFLKTQGCLFLAMHKRKSWMRQTIFEKNRENAHFEICQQRTQYSEQATLGTRDHLLSKLVLKSCLRKVYTPLSWLSFCDLTRPKPDFDWFIKFELLVTKALHCTVGSNMETSC